MTKPRRWKTITICDDGTCGQCMQCALARMDTRLQSIDGARTAVIDNHAKQLDALRRDSDKHRSAGIKAGLAATGFAVASLVLALLLIARW